MVPRGVGGRQKQAEALFSICDEDKGGCVNRAELLKFIAGSLPEDTAQHKTETFSKVWLYTKLNPHKTWLLFSF